MVIKNPSSLFSFTLSTMPLIILLLFFFAFLLQEDFLKHNYGLIYFCVPHLHPLFKHCLKTHFLHVTSPTNLFSNSIWVFGFSFCWMPCQIKLGLDPIILSHASFATEVTGLTTHISKGCCTVLPGGNLDGNNCIFYLFSELSKIFPSA